MNIVLRKLDGNDCAVYLLLVVSVVRDRLR